MELETYYISFDPDDFESGINMIALTENPAIGVFALRFSKEGGKMKFQLNHEKRLIVGPAMIPEYRMYRTEGDREFYVVFSQETIDGMLEKFKSEQREVQINLEHDGEKTVKGFVKEAWIIEDPKMDKALLYDFKLPKGTLMFSVKIEDEKIWEEVVKQMDNVGFSIEGLMGLDYEKHFKETSIKNEKKMSKTKSKTKKRRVFAGRIVSKRKFNTATKKFENVEITEDDEILVVEELEEGAKVEAINEAGETEAAKDGDYVLKDEDIVITVEEGEITDMVEVEKEAEETQAEETQAEDEVYQKLAELESRIEALEAYMANAQDMGFNKKEKFNKEEIARSERLDVLRQLVGK